MSSMTRIALVVLDTLRKDTFEEYFDWLPGRYYTDAVSTSHWTIAAHASMVTGQYPGELGVNMKDTERGGFDGPVLAERLQRSGFRTRALTANHYLAYSDGWDRGFDEFYTPWHLQNKRAFETADLMSDVTNGAEPSGLADTLRLIYASEESTWRSLRLLIRMSLPGVTHEMPDDGAQNVLNWVESNASSLREDEFLYVNLMEAHTPLDPRLSIIRQVNWSVSRNGGVSPKTCPNRIGFEQRTRMLCGTSLMCTKLCLTDLLSRTITSSLAPITGRCSVTGC